jgi:adenosylhomocysteine nucleosidase
MKKILIVFAMEDERDVFKKTLNLDNKSKVISHQLEIIDYHSKTLFLLQTGVTMMNAFFIAKVMEQYSIDEVLNIGTCAGLKNQPIGFVIRPKTFFNADLDMSMFGRTKGMLVKVNNQDIQPPILVSGSTFVANDEQKAKLIEEFNADAFDMESFAYAQVCQSYQIPFKVFRGVTDNGDASAEQSFENNLILAVQSATKEALKYLDSL